MIVLDVCKLFVALVLLHMLAARSFFCWPVPALPVVFPIDAVFGERGRAADAGRKPHCEEQPAFWVGLDVVGGCMRMELHVSPRL